MSEQPIFCILSTESTPPKEARDLWGKGEICGKPLFPYRGQMYSVYFPNTPAVWRGKTYTQGFKVTWPFLRDEVVFSEISPGIMKGILKSADVAE